jgi:hypothetical protein
MLCAQSIRALTISNCNNVIPMGRLVVPTVNTTPGAVLELAMLASGRRSSVAVDLATNAIVRVHHPRQAEIDPFAVVQAHLGTPSLDRPEQPESIDTDETLRPIGRLQGLRCERLLRSIDTTPVRPTLGITGPGVALWQLDGSRPSVEIVRAPFDTDITVDERGVRCRFSWVRGAEELPIEDPRLLRQLDWLPSGPISLRACARALGFRPTRMTVALGRPRNGYCYKVVAALLP